MYCYFNNMLMFCSSSAVNSLEWTVFVLYMNNFQPNLFINQGKDYFFRKTYISAFE